MHPIENPDLSENLGKTNIKIDNDDEPRNL